MKQLRRLFVMLAALLLLGPAFAQETAEEQGAAEEDVLFEDVVGAINLRVVAPTPVAEVTAGDNTVLISAPAEADEVAVVREGFEGVEVHFSTVAEPEAVFEYYRALMEAQDFELVSANFDVEVGAFEGTDAQHIQAVFTRPGDRIDFLLDREQAPIYVAHFEVETTYGYYNPYYYGAYGAYPYYFYGPVGYYGLPPASPTALRFVAPTQAEDVLLERPESGVFRYTITTEMTLEEIHDFYAEVLAQEGFEEVEGELGEEGGEFVYAIDGNEVTMTITTIDDNSFEVVFDLSGLAGQAAEAE